MNTIMRRLQSGERWWAAEAVLRTLGLVSLAMCAGATDWLYGSLHTQPAHQASALELLAGVPVVFGWCMGWPLFLLGKGLFKPVVLSSWRVGFTLPTRREPDE